MRLEQLHVFWGGGGRVGEGGGLDVNEEVKFLWKFKIKFRGGGRWVGGGMSGWM